VERRGAVEVVAAQPRWGGHALYVAVDGFVFDESPCLSFTQGRARA
jgi:hypothetical protein